MVLCKLNVISPTSPVLGNVFTALLCEQLRQNDPNSKKHHNPSSKESKKEKSPFAIAKLELPKASVGRVLPAQLRQQQSAMQRMEKWDSSELFPCQENCIADLHPDTALQARSLYCYHGNLQTAPSSRLPPPLSPSLLLPPRHQGMDAAEALDGFVPPSLHASTRMEEAGERSMSVGTCSPQSHGLQQTSSKTHFQRVWKPLCFFKKWDRKRKAGLESLSGNACRVQIFESSTTKAEWLLNHNKSYLAFL